MSGSLHEERGYRVVNVQNIVITMYLSAIQCAMYKGRNYMLCKVILVVGLCCHFSNVCLDLLCTFTHESYRVAMLQVMSHLSRDILCCLSIKRFHSDIEAQLEELQPQPPFPFCDTRRLLSHLHFQKCREIL
jgi:hypothetical protein